MGDFRGLTMLRLRTRSVLGLAGAALGCSRLHCEETTISNWSGTHEVRTQVYHEPEDLNQLLAIVKQAHALGGKIRPVGSALSPNGLGLCSGGMINLLLCDKVISVDQAKQQVTVQAGARVSQVVEALSEYGLTLQNYASIAEQQIAGFIQVGAHGTGAAIPPADETVVRLKLVTPARGLITLSATQEPELFKMARVGLGALGVVAEVTLQCQPAHRLEEVVYVSTADQIRVNRTRLLQENKHLRLMWIPHTDQVVVVTCNPTDKPVQQSESNAQALLPLTQLLEEVSGSPAPQAMNFGQLRDVLLAVAPLDPEHVKAVNKAEALFWEASSGTRVDWSHKVLGFECGGEQWVWENVFHVDQQQDIDCITELLAAIERDNLPAPSPIEQRWSSHSTASMSPVSEPGLHSWLGVIMYLPTEDKQQRADITRSFEQYCDRTAGPVLAKVSAKTHWAKIEMPHTQDQAAQIRSKLAECFPVDEFNRARRECDPKRILSNDLIDALFGVPERGPFVLMKQMPWQSA